MKDASSKDLAVRQQLAREIRDACINVGFFYGKSAVEIYLRSELVITC